MVNAIYCIAAEKKSGSGLLIGSYLFQEITTYKSRSNSPTLGLHPKAVLVAEQKNKEEAETFPT